VATRFGVVDFQRGRANYFFGGTECCGMFQDKGVVPEYLNGKEKEEVPQKARGGNSAKKYEIAKNPPRFGVVLKKKQKVYYKGGKTRKLDRA